jgi:hypothetical protein
MSKQQLIEENRKMKLYLQRQVIKKQDAEIATLKQQVIEKQNTEIANLKRQIIEKQNAEIEMLKQQLERKGHFTLNNVHPSTQCIVCHDVVCTNKIGNMCVCAGTWKYCDKHIDKTKGYF